MVGFFEVIIWLIAIRAVIENLNNIVCYLAYGAGFAMGTFVGLTIEKKLAIGSSLIRIITQKDATDLIFHLRCQGFGVTSMEAASRPFPVLEKRQIIGADAGFVIKCFRLRNRT